MKQPATRKLRCAIYTRKSTEEGLDMEFNSLDAQREACGACIASQRTEGRVELADQYDDGGFLVMADPEGNEFCVIPEGTFELDDEGRAHYLA